MTGIDNSTSFNVDPADIAGKLGLTGLPPLPSGNAVPNFVIQGFQQTGGTNSSIARQRTYQILDNFTWTRSNHAVKFGGDFRYLEGLSTNVYANLRLGQYTFDNSVTRDLIGVPFAAFLLGVPDQTRLNTVVQPDSDGYAKTYAFYVQDDWKVSSKLTVNYGLRWEYHPMFNDRLLLPNVAGWGSAFDVTNRGIYIIGPAISGAGQRLAFFSFGTGHITSLAATPGEINYGLAAASPDDLLILYAQRENVGGDLMVVENFR